MISRCWVLVGIVSLILTSTIWAFQGHDANPDFPAIPFDHKAIQYSERPANDPVARLQKQVEKGEVKLEFHPKWGYLPAVLEHLGIHVDSQVLVFSKTSSQVTQISPQRPRALYFNDAVSVGYVQQGQFLELASLDPNQGMIFYTLDVQKSDKPSFSRQEMDCLKCHMSPATLNIPGIMVSSVYPTDQDSPYGRAGSFATDHRIPLEDRWGGWYVTGLHGSIRHRGNVPVDSFDSLTESELRQSQNLTRLDERLNTSAYLAPTSDIVALMTFEHQTRMTNLITRIGWETRVAIADKNLKEFQTQLDSDIDELVTYMLFADEAPLSSPIQGVSSFTKSFPQSGPRDKQSRSLRDFDLRKRLFRYPLSYMIYSPAFDSLPDIARNEIYRKLYEALTGKDTNQKLAHLSAEDRRAVLEILRDTKPNLPAFFK
ncbi:MAG: hypothetical protein HY313_03140 [Acidobacteria bacterium]|nr:hypothetical protein [Acidobacteriota bacterium]